MRGPRCSSYPVPCNSPFRQRVCQSHWARTAVANSGNRHLSFYKLPQQPGLRSVVGGSHLVGIVSKRKPKLAQQPLYTIGQWTKGRSIDSPITRKTCSADLDDQQRVTTQTPCPYNKSHCAIGCRDKQSKCHQPRAISSARLGHPTAFQ